MNPAYLDLAHALEERLAVIADREWAQRDPAAHLVALQTVSEKLDVLVASLSRPLPGELAHYLDRRSYAKALAWIQNEG